MQPQELVLDRVYRWEKERAGKRFMVQPLGGGALREYTWGEAVGEARRMAAHLKSLGFPPGSRIAIISKNCAHFILCDLAIWMAGHVSVALYPTADAKSTRYVLEHCEARLLFVGKLDSWDELAKGIPEGLPRISLPLAPPIQAPTWEELLSKTAPIEGTPSRGADELALILYTSGSTGTPKGVMHSFGTYTAAARGFLQFAHVEPDYRMISYLPLAHAFERACIEAVVLYAGNQVFFVEALDTFMDDLRRAQPTFFHSVPRLWLKFQLGVFEKVPEKRLRLLLKVPVLGRLLKKKILRGLGLDQTRLAASGSAPIPPEVVQWYRELGLELLEGYGMTENFSYSHANSPGRVGLGTVGDAMAGVECKLGEDGEVLVKSPANMMGYYKEPELTAQAFTADGFLKTGDQGGFDAQGRLRITGRVKELFKTSKGKYVAPAPIENLLNADALLEQSCVMGVGMPQPCAVVLLSEQTIKQLESSGAKQALEGSLERLLSEVNAQLADHERLEFLAVASEPWLITNGLLTPTMKIKRSALEARYVPRLAGWYSSGAPVQWEAA